MTLDTRQVEDFDRDGFIVIPQLLGKAEVEKVRLWVNEIASWEDTPGRWLHHRETVNDKPVLTRTENFLPYHEGLRAVLQGAMANAVGQLFREPALVFKEKINYKLSGGAGYAAHQDAPAYPMGDRHITCMLAVDDSTPENGGLEFAAGHHRAGLMATGPDGCLTPEDAQRMAWQATTCLRGGAMFFDSFTPHRSGQNHSKKSRCMLYVTYNAASQGNLRDAYYAQKAALIEQGRVSLIGHFQGKVI